VKSNDFVSLMLQSPLHVLMGNMMLITVTGRRTGGKITLPVNYYRDGDTLWILSKRSRTWWRNVLPGAAVRLHLNGKNIKGMPDLVLDEAAVASRLREYIQGTPSAAAYLGVRVQKGMANTDDVRRVAQDRLFVGVCVSEDRG